jgi:hypothetical protein
MAFACELVALVVVHPPEAFVARHAAVGPVPKENKPRAPVEAPP